MKQPTVLIRCDASPRIGGGHAMRCLTLANSLRENAFKVCFASRRPTYETVVSLCQSGHQLIELREQDDCHAVLRQKLPHVDWLVIDHYDLDASWTSPLRGWARRVLVIDDLANRQQDCDFLLDQTLGRQPADYTRLVPTGCRMLLGPDFSLLRPQFAAVRGKALAKRAEGGAVRRLLVSLGATDSKNMTSRVISAASGLALELDIVLGAGNQYHEAVMESVKRLKIPARIHTDVSDMATLMVQADLAVGAGGTTSWERCCLGLPSVILVLADNQLGIAAALDKAGAAVNLGTVENLSDSNLAEALHTLCSDDRSRTAMSEQAAAICDGGGVGRVLRAIENG